MIRRTAKLRKTCRMCGKHFDNRPLLMLYQKYKQFKDYPINIIQKYNLVNFEIFEDDGLPQQICNKCFQEFKSINQFIESCINVQNNLKMEFSHLKLYKTENLMGPTDKKIDNEHKNSNSKTKNKVKTKNLLPKTVLEIAQIRPDFEEIVFDDPLNSENYEENLNSDKKECEDVNELLKNSTEYKNNNIDDDESSSEEYFNDNFQEDFTIFCEFCKKVFTDISKLEDHQQQKHKMKFYNKFFICEHCGEFIIHYRFEEHVEGIHEGKKGYNCEFCKRDFQKFRSFKEHSLKYHQSDQFQKSYDNKEKFPCLQCNRVYLHAGVLQTHMKKMHSGIKKDSDKKLTEKSLTQTATFQCDICKIKFRNIVSMEKHRANHANEKYEHKFKCPDCDRRFGRRDHLKYHIRLEHLKEKPYKCLQCDKSYVIGFQLNTHMKLVHSNDKKKNRAGCDSCNKTFYSRRYLERHKKEVHSFDAQFVCVICDEKFFKQIHLIRHAQIHNIEENCNMEEGSEHENEIQNNESDVKEIIKYVETVKNENIDSEIENEVSILVENDDEIDFNVYH